MRVIYRLATPPCRGSVPIDRLAQLRVFTRGRLRIRLPIRMNRDRRPLIEETRLETRFEKTELDARRGTDYGFVGKLPFECSSHLHSQRHVFSRVWSRRPEHRVVRLVENFPNDSATREVPGRRNRPTCIGCASFIAANRLALGVERIAVVENEEGAKMIRLKPREQLLVRSKIIFATFTFGELPNEISSDPTKACIGNHFYFCRIGIDEVNVDAEGLADRDRLLSRRLPTAFAVNGSVIGRGEEREDERNKSEAGTKLHWSTFTTEDTEKT